MNNEKKNVDNQSEIVLLIQILEALILTVGLHKKFALLLVSQHLIRYLWHYFCLIKNNQFWGKTFGSSLNLQINLHQDNAAKF